jgi:hypothetical protein
VFGCVRNGGKRYHSAMERILTALLLVLLSAPLMRGDDDPSSRLSLRGVKTFDVVVEDLPNVPGLTRDDLQTDVELRCRQAGIKLEDSPAAYLHVILTFQELHYADGRSANSYAVAITVEFNQQVLLQRDPTIHVMAPTWSKRSVATMATRDLRSWCRESVRDKVDKFLNAFLEQNPR